MPLLFGLLLCLAGALPAKAVPLVAAGPVDVELVLAVDISRSMDAEEFALQRAGYVAALRHPDFVRAVRAGQYGRIALTYFEWAGTVREETQVPWQVIDSAEAAEAFAAALESRPVRSFRGTSISGALVFGTGLFDANAFDGRRKVIDVSGDGPNNIGVPVVAARDAAVMNGITVNGLPILIRPSFTVRELDRYYAECVTGGPGSFVLPIRDASEFATAIRRKLILEVSGAPDAGRVIPAQAAEPMDCERGERERRLFSDPHFPELDR
ncbi:MAG TPA: DUF1194 domain-containing protein [Rhizobiaceae bacterium]